MTTCFDLDMQLRHIVQLLSSLHVMHVTIVEDIRGNEIHHISLGHRV